MKCLLYTRGLAGIGTSDKEHSRRSTVGIVRAALTQLPRLLRRRFVPMAGRDRPWWCHQESSCLLQAAPSSAEPGASARTGSLPSYIQTRTALADAGLQQVRVWSFAFSILQHEKLHQRFSVSTINVLW